MDTQTVAETIARACGIRPVLKPFLETFEPLLSQRSETALKLAPMLAQADKSLKGMPGDKPLLRERAPSGLAPYIAMAARDLLPLLLAQQAIAPYAEGLKALFMDPDNEGEREKLALAMLADTPDALAGLAEKQGLRPEILDFASGFIVSAVFRALAFPYKDEEFPDWHRNSCPVCGSRPIMAWLGKRPFTQNNEFLADGGGKKHLHCGLCGTDWHFLRGVCPSCGAQGQDAMQIIGEEDRRHERIDWCKKCRRYLPQVDLRELIETPDMDAMALCLMHLDLVAADKELLPLKPSFWNMF